MTVTAAICIILVLALHPSFVRDYGQRIPLSRRKLVSFETAVFLIGAAVALAFTLSIGFGVRALLGRILVAGLVALVCGLIVIGLAGQEGQSRISLLSRKLLSKKDIVKIRGKL